ncbi:tetratricopeptide repeat protein [bacterium]|nr:tetratricopeptide repeat protein [bacterium]
MNNLINSRQFHLPELKTGLVFSLIILTVIAIYGNALTTPFVFDDAGNIVANMRLRDMGNFLKPDIFSTPRAIVELTFAINYRLGGLKVPGYHIVNIIIHLINGILAYLLALMLFMKTLKDMALPKIRAMALFAALIFVAHPLQTQAVTYIVQRFTSMAAMFYLLSILCYLKGRLFSVSNGLSDVKKSGMTPFLFYLAASISGIFAILSKQNAASLPFMIILIEYIFIDRSWKGWKRKIPCFLVILLFWALFILYMTGALGGIQGILIKNEGMAVDFSSLPDGRIFGEISRVMREKEGLGRWNYLVTQFNVLVIYMRLLILPAGQSADYMYPFKKGFFDGLTPLVFLILMSILLLGLRQIKRHPVISLSIFWFFLALSVESSFIPISDALVEHRLYLPMFGFAVIASYLLFYIFSKTRCMTAILASLIILSLCTATFLRNRVWAERTSLWADVLSKNPENYRAWNNLGNELANQGEHEKAIEMFKNAAGLRSDFPVTWSNWGNALVKMGFIDEALEKHKKALECDPYYIDGLYNYGVALIIKGKPEDAVRILKKTVAAKPGHADAWYNLGIAAEMTGRHNDAVEMFKKAGAINGSLAEVWYNWGGILERQGKLEEAIAKYAKAVNIRPDYAEAWNNWGASLSKLGRFDEAIEKYKMAANVKPEHASAWYNWGVALGNMGRLHEAVQKFAISVSLRPEHAEAWYNWGAVLEMMGRPEEAVNKYEKAANIRPDYINALNNRADILYKMGKKAEAAEIYNRVAILQQR